MGCSASRADGLEHEEALQHVIQMMRELKVKQIANIAARREGRRSREKYYGWAGVQGARAIAGGDAVLRRASIAHANWRRGGPVTVAIAPGTLLDLPADVTDTILDFLLEVSEKRDLSLGVQPRLDENITPATVQRWRRESYSTSASVLSLVHSWGSLSRISASFAAGPWAGYLDRRPALAASWHERLYGVKIDERGVETIDALLNEFALIIPEATNTLVFVRSIIVMGQTEGTPMSQTVYLEANQTWPSETLYIHSTEAGRHHYHSHSWHTLPHYAGGGAMDVHTEYTHGQVKVPYNISRRRDMLPVKLRVDGV